MPRARKGVGAQRGNDEAAGPSRCAWGTPWRTAYEQGALFGRSPVWYPPHRTRSLGRPEATPCSLGGACPLDRSGVRVRELRQGCTAERRSEMGTRTPIPLLRPPYWTTSGLLAIDMKAPSVGILDRIVVGLAWGCLDCPLRLVVSDRLQTRHGFVIPVDLPVCVRCPHRGVGFRCEHRDRLP
jgi:hypothetical protein